MTGHEITPDDLHACHRLKNKDRVISKFKDKKLKRSIQINRKVLQQKAVGTFSIKISGKLFISESMSYENQQLAYKCCQLKNSKKIHLTWYFRVIPNGEFHQIFHTTVTEKSLGIENLEDFINNTSF